MIWRRFLLAFRDALSSHLTKTQWSICVSRWLRRFVPGARHLWSNPVLVLRILSATIRRRLICKFSNSTLRICFSFVFSFRYPNRNHHLEYYSKGAVSLCGRHAIRVARKNHGKSERSVLQPRWERNPYMSWTLQREIPDGYQPD